MDLKVEYVSIDKLIPYVNNAKKHPDWHIKQIASSIKEFGFADPLGIADDYGILTGHGRFQAAMLLGLKEVPCIKLSNLTPAQRKAYIIQHNKLTMNTGMDEELLKIELQSLAEMEFKLEYTGFSDKELKKYELGNPSDIQQDDTYTKKIKAPIYEPSKEKPAIKELLNYDKSKALIEEINNSSLPKEEKEFLKSAAQRHIIFNYENIAEYYSHSDKVTQQLMEKSALVIIDFDKAIENGFVVMSKDLAEAYNHDDE